MNDIFSKKQIEKLNEISKLPEDKQKKELSKFLEELSPEQLEYLKKSGMIQDKQECLFCSLASGKIRAYKIYEDNNLMAVLDINPANLGHTLLFPKKHVKSLLEIKYDTALMNVIVVIASNIVKVVKANSFNIYIANGIEAGQRLEHLVVNIIPRFKDDKIDFNWNSKKVNENDLLRISNAVRENIEMLKKQSEIDYVEYDDEKIP